MKIYATIEGETPDETECVKIALGYGANEEPLIRGQQYGCGCGYNKIVEESDAYKAALLALKEEGGFSAPSKHFTNGGWYRRGEGAVYTNVYGVCYGWVTNPAFTTLDGGCESIEEMWIISSCLRWARDLRF